MSKISFITLSLIIFFSALFLRVYKLDQIPASLNWDEVAAGYNAYTIANWGMDEWGEKFPLVFTSFREDKHPVHIYITSVFVKLFSLNDFVTRLPSALIGSFTVLLMIVLGEIIFNNKIVGLFSGIFLALSPYHLQFSRGLWESNFALSFYVLGLVLFYLGLTKKNWLIPFSFFSFGISFFAYHSAKVLVPPTILLLIILEFKKLYEEKKYFWISVFVILFFTVVTIANPRILGLARIAQNRLPDSTILGQGKIVLTTYVKYFDINYLFVLGDQNPRNSVKVVGEFYKIVGFLLIPGILAFVKYRSKKILVLLLWIFLAPLPGAFTGVVDANRGIFMVGAVNLVAGAGAYFLLDTAKKTWFKIILTLIILSLLGFEFKKYITYYYQYYNKKDAIEWQYGMKDAVLYSQKHREFTSVYVDKIRQQPYIFFLYYLKTPLPTFLKSVKYDQTQANTFNTVSSFGKYNFGNWDPIESYPSSEILYVITPSYYSGLRYLAKFDVKKLIKYPSGADAFYLVSGNEN
jgi:4-amino-4-deoxy-L-arabinose transferase-like glycosyltransferase